VPVNRDLQKSFWNVSIWEGIQLNTDKMAKQYQNLWMKDLKRKSSQIKIKNLYNVETTSNNTKKHEHDYLLTMTKVFALLYISLMSAKQVYFYMTNNSMSYSCTHIDYQTLITISVISFRYKS